VCDRCHIEALIARYADACNRADFDAWADCFTPSGVFSGVAGQFRAHADLPKFVEASHRLMQDWPGLRLSFTNVVTELVGNAGTARSLLTMTTSTETESRIVFLADYHDRLEKHDDRWLFAERIVQLAR
jgi:uncharacterized protein (TIGR02246 family)